MGVAGLGLLAAAALVAGCGGGGTTTVTVTGTTGATTVPPATDPTPTTPTAPATDTVATAPTDSVVTALPPPRTDAATTAPAPPPPPPSPGPPAPPPPLVPRPPGFPNGGEAFLISRLGPAVRERCTREPVRDRSRGAIAGVVCETRSALGAKSWYELFPSVRALEASYARYRSAQDVPIGVRNCPNVRQPPLPGETTWFYRQERDDIQGRVMCFRESDGDYWLIWTHESLRAMGFATARRYLSASVYWTRQGSLTEAPRS